jgi:hypothetical protein
MMMVLKLDRSEYQEKFDKPPIKIICAVSDAFRCHTTSIRVGIGAQAL